MPMKSEAQRAFLHANEPEVAEEFEKATPKGKRLPKHVKGSESPVAKAKGKKAKAAAKAKVKAKAARESATDNGRTEGDVLEFTKQSTFGLVDREKGVIHGVHLCGTVSRNQGRYTIACLEAAKGLYEGAKCNINHPDRSAPGKDRMVEDRFGMYHNVEVNEKGVYADLHFLKSHPMANQVCEAAERMPEALGFSQNATTIQVPDEQGGVIHESIKRLRSVDLVADPATTNSIFESEETCMDGMMEDTAAPAEAAPESVEGEPIDAALDALLAKYLPEIKAAEKGARKPLIKDLMKKVDALIEALGDEPSGEEEASEETTGGETGGTETEESDKTETKEGTEVKSEEKPEEKAATESAEEKAKTPEKPSYEQALDVLESVGVTPSSFYIKMLMAVPEPDRKALAESWKKPTADSGSVKPKSSSVLESAKAEDKATSTSLSEEQLKDDAMLLMAGNRF